ncbi:MAG TPA: tetratricopeptide repeat protein [Acidobacteriota bacterium]|nr:tetratricopeptide repeat protein [Acidobacteriota bacterium]HNT17174.1 tetratricopeptide repeat protein [Acidobacteriota bacterium]
MVKAAKKREKKPVDAAANAAVQTAAPGGRWLAVVIFFLAVITYLPVLNHTFHSWDDPVYITSNERVLEGLNAGNVKWAFTTTYFGFYYPLTWLSHMTDVQFFGTDPRGHYLTSVVLHSVNAVLLFFLIMLVTGSPLKSSAVSAFFALHPMNVESVAWLAERKNLLSALFLVLALICYLIVHRPGAEKRKTLLYRLLLYSFFVMGLMSKSSIVMFPVLLLIADFWPLGRFGAPGDLRSTLRTLGSLVVQKIPLFLISLASGILTILAQRDTGTMAALSHVAFGHRVGEAFLGLGFYLYKLVLPFNLCALYTHHEGNYHPLLPLLIAAGLFAATFLFFKLRKSSPVLMAGWLFFLVSLLPVLGLLQVGMQAYADRYVYFPYWGLFAMAVIGIPWEKLTAGKTWRKVMVGASFLVVAAIFFSASRVQIATWRDDGTLFENIIKRSPGAVMAYVELGNVHADKGDPDRAGSLYRKALELCDAELAEHPRHPGAYYNKASVLFNLRRYEESLQCFRLAREHGHEAKKLTENMKAAKIMIIQEAVKKGKQAMTAESWGEAEGYFRKASEIEPGMAEAWSYLAYALEMQGKYEEAKRCYGRAILLDPSLDVETFNLALLELKTGEPDKARGRLSVLEKMNSPHALKLRDLLELP